MLNSIFNYLIKFIEIIFRSVYLLFALALIILSSYYFGNTIIDGVTGGDTAYNFSVIYWFDHWFPKIPLWYPLQGGGVSIVYGYHFLAHLGTVLVSRASGLTLENSFQMLSFVSVLLVSLGIYFFVWTRLKNQTAALIASLFYFLSPISWVWLIYWGFYGESMSYIFILPSLIFFDVFLCSVLERRVNWVARLSLILGAISLSLLWFTHALAFLGIITFFPFYGILYSFLSAKNQRFKKTLYGILAVFVFLAVTYLISAFHEINFQYYSLQSKRAGSASKEFFFKDASEWYFKPFLTLAEIPQGDRRFAERNVAFAVPVWAMALVGLIFSYWLSKKLFVIGLFSALNFLFIYYFAPVWWYLNLTGAQHYRPLIIPLRVFLPVLAGFGAVAIPHIFFSLVFLWKRYLKGSILLYIDSIKSILVGASALAIAVGAVILFRYYSVSPPSVRYGTDQLDFRTIADEKWPYLCHTKDNPFRPQFCSMKPKGKADKYILGALCAAKKEDIIRGRAEGKLPSYCEDKSDDNLGELAKKCRNNSIEKDNAVFCEAVIEPINRKLALSKWPKFRLDTGIKDTTFMTDIYKEFLKIKDEKETVRVDVSPNLGTTTQSFNVNNFDDSMLNLWGYQSSLNHSYWGYQQSTFYGKDRRPIPIYNVAKWYGTQFVLINIGADPETNFTQDPEHWIKEGEGIFRLKPEVKLYSFSQNKPLILVIGNEKQTAYETFFKLANEGMLYYDDAFSVSGKKNIDDYSFEDLRKFDGLILFGYSYKNKNSAFKLLDRYIKEVGSVYLSTGWQFVDRDWEIEKAPDFFPVSSLSWTSDFDSQDYKTKGSILDGVDSKKFSPLKWGDQPWGVSAPSGLKPWAERLVTVSDRPVVAGGSYGKGKIIWSGINWFGHISAYSNNPEEVKLLSNIFKFLFEKENFDEDEDTSMITMKRDFPDKVEFSFRSGFNSGNFYLRESFHPDWKAYLVSKNSKEKMKIYKSGPLYKLVNLPQVKAGDTLIFEYSNGLRGIIATIISLVTLIILLAYLILGVKLIKPIAEIASAYSRIAKNYGKRHVSKLSVKANEDEDY